MLKRSNQMFVCLKNSFISSLILLLLGISSVVYAAGACDSACTGTTSASTCACALTKWSTDQKKCLLEGSTSKKGNCNKQSGVEGDCSACICAPPSSHYDPQTGQYPAGDSCFCHHSGF